MPQLSNVSNNKSFYKPLNVKPIEPHKKKISSQAKLGIGIGLTALASGGIYIASRGRVQNVNKIFDNIKNADSIMDVLKNVKLAPKKFKELMFKISDDENLSEKFVKEVISNPRKSKENVRILNNKIGGDNELMDWALRPRGYQEAYYRYTKKTYNEAQNTDDLLKLSPNWNIWKLKDRFGEDFTIGEPPKEFGGIEGFRRTITESRLFGNDKARNINGIEFKDYITGGMSGKGVRKVEAGGKKYILKFQVSDMNHSDYDLKDNLSMKSDSTFLNAQLDRFLELNHYENGPKLRFFDYKTNSALYEMSEGVKPPVEKVHDIIKLNEELKELNSLGVYYNDVNTGNFLVQGDKMSFIDSGESTFVDFFKPGVTGYHFTLPNLNGRSVTNSAAAIMLSKTK